MGLLFLLAKHPDIKGPKFYIGQTKDKSVLRCSFPGVFFERFHSTDIVYPGPFNKPANFSV